MSVNNFAQVKAVVGVRPKDEFRRSKLLANQLVQLRNNQCLILSEGDSVSRADLVRCVRTQLGSMGYSLRSKRDALGNRICIWAEERKDGSLPPDTRA